MQNNTVRKKTQMKKEDPNIIFFKLMKPSSTQQSFQRPRVHLSRMLLYNKIYVEKPERHIIFKKKKIYEASINAAKLSVKPRLHVRNVYFCVAPQEVFVRRPPRGGGTRGSPVCTG